MFNYIVQSCGIAGLIISLIIYWATDKTRQELESQKMKRKISEKFSLVDVDRITYIRHSLSDFKTTKIDMEENSEPLIKYQTLYSEDILKILREFSEVKEISKLSNFSKILNVSKTSRIFQDLSIDESEDLKIILEAIETYISNYSKESIYIANQLNSIGKNIEKYKNGENNG